MFQRVLCRHDQERLRKLVGVVIDRDAALLHGLEQAALRAWRCPVDFVREHHVREERTRPGLEVGCLGVVHRDSDHVGGQQVGRELDATEAHAERFREGMRERGLAHSRHVFEEDVPAREQRRERQLDHFLFSMKNRLDLIHQVVEQLQ